MPHKSKLPNTKSLSAALVEVEERVSAKKLEKQPKLSDPSNCVRLMPPSKNVPWG